MLHAVSPHALVIVAIVAIQIGAAVAIYLFQFIGAEGTVALRIVLSAALLFLGTRYSRRDYWFALQKHGGLLAVFGACIATMNLLFYLAIERIPLGTAVTLEFAGPLLLAACNSQRWVQLAWVALSAIGIVLLSPLAGSDLDVVGVIFALLAGAAWALFIVLSKRVGAKVDGTLGLRVGMLIAAVIVSPLAIPIIDKVLFDGVIIIAVIAVALLSTTIPFILEFTALQSLPARSYGVLISLEPGVATLIGALMLQERVTLIGLFAVGCVIVAAIGVTLSDQRNNAN